MWFFYFTDKTTISETGFAKQTKLESRSVSNELSYDVIVIGAGHAGCEAAYIAAQIGSITSETLTDAIGQTHAKC